MGNSNKSISCEKNIRFWCLKEQAFSYTKTCKIATTQGILAQTTVPHCSALFTGHGPWNQNLFFAEPPPSVGALENACFLKFERADRANIGIN